MTFTGRDTVTIQQDSSAAGDPVPNYSGTALATGIPCMITNVRGQETYRGRQLEALVDFVVEMRHRSDITHTMRLSVTGGLWNGSTLNVEAVQPVQLTRGRPPMLLLMCTHIPSG